MSRFLLSALIACALINGAANANAAELVYDNGAPDQQNGWEITQYIAADDFTCTHPTRLDRVKFWDYESQAGFSGTVAWQIHANGDDDGPGRLLASGTVNNIPHRYTGFSALGGYKEYENDVAFGPVVLPAGIYWLALHDGELNSVSTKSVYWATTAKSGPRPSHGAAPPFYRPWWNNVFPGINPDVAFALEGAVLPRITELSLQGGNARINFTTVIGEQYRVEVSNGIGASASWATLAGADTVPGTGGIVQVTDPQPDVRSLPRRFYRVVML